MNRVFAAARGLWQRRLRRSLLSLRHDPEATLERRVGKAQVRQELLADAEVAAAVAEHARSTGEDLSLIHI